LFAAGKLIQSWRAVNDFAFSGNFVVDQSPTGGHPLGVARQDHTLVALVVVMINPPFEHVSHCFDAAMRVFAEHAAREPILHKGQERIGGRPVAAHRGLQ